MQGHQAV